MGGSRHKKRRKFYVALSRILIRGPYLNVQPRWYRVYQSLEEAVPDLAEIAFKQPFRIESMEDKIIRTPRRIFKVTRFSGYAERSSTNLRMYGEIIKWITPAEIRYEVINWKMDDSEWNFKNIDIIKTVTYPSTRYDVIKIVYKDDFEEIGDIWLLRRFYEDTMKKSGYFCQSR